MCEFFASFNLTYCCCACVCQSSVIMFYFRRYISSRPRGFLLVSFQATKLNKKEIKRKNFFEKLNNENEQNENKMKTKWKQKRK